MPVAAALIWLIWTKRRGSAVLPPVILVLGAVALGMGYYFARFNGNPFVLPYSLYRNTVTMAPHFIWQSPRPEPVYHHRAVRDF